jgi:hypothetical protein
MPFSQQVKTDALVASGRCCCICHRFCGTKIECHHIVQEADGGPSTTENCIPLCFDCHADMLAYDPNHPRGTRYRPEELRLHRDNWFAKVSGANAATYGGEHRRVDRMLLERVLRVLPWEGSMRFIHINNFAGFSFDLRMLRDLNEFDARCEDPAWEFVDPTLEAMRAALSESIGRLLHLIAFETFPTQHEYRNSVPQEWEIEQPERFHQVVGDIHSAAKRSVDAYKALVREGRHRLAVGVPPEEDALNDANR